MTSIIDLVKKYKLIIIVALISATIVVSITYIFVAYKENKNYKKAEEQIIELSQNIIKAYQTKPSYWGLSTSEIINKKLYAYNMKVIDSKLIGYFANNVEVGADSNGSTVMPTEKHFVIAYKNLNKKQCIGLVSQKFNKSFWLSVNKITIKNDKISRDFDWGNVNYALPINNKNLESACVSEQNTIIMQF